MDTQRRKELTKEKRIERLIRKEEYQEAMNKLPIDERAIIKDVLKQIHMDNLQMVDDERNRRLDVLRKRAHAESQIKIAEFRERIILNNLKGFAIACGGTLAYIGLTLIVR